jgi:uncharacterized protein (DUF736 family)
MEQQINSGAIFKNEKKADNHPDYKGKINVDGVDKEIALWLKTSKDGKTKYFSVKVSEPYQKPTDQPAPKAPEPADDFLTSDLPF